MYNTKKRIYEDDRIDMTDIIANANASHLVNYDNYGRYADLVLQGYTSIHTSVINKDTIEDHYNSILNIFRDGIEESRIHDSVVYVTFIDGETVKLSVFDYFMNLIFWHLPVLADVPVTSDYLFFAKIIKQGTIKRYIDRFIDIYKSQIDIEMMNIIINKTLDKFQVIDDFSYYYFNTIDEFSTVKLMLENPEVDAIMHTDISNIPLDRVVTETMDAMLRMVDIMCEEDSDHCLKEALQCGESVNKKQLREYMVSIGSTPDGNGGIIPMPANGSYCMFGTYDFYILFQDMLKAMIALLLEKKNVGHAGDFSRLLSLNNIGTKLHSDPHYDCGTKNYLIVNIKSEKDLNMYKNRFYKFHPDGPEYLFSSDPIRNESHLIGKTLYLRSPMTCASHSRGEGVCYKCYGTLAFVNKYLNIGQLAAEILGAVLTQMLLSAKHLLETHARPIIWSKSFNNFFIDESNSTIIKLNPEKKFKKCKMLIDEEALDISGDYDENSITMIQSFDIIDHKGNKHPIYTTENHNMILKPGLMNILRNKKVNPDDKCEIDLSELYGIELFEIDTINNDLQYTLNQIKGIIDKSTYYNKKVKMETIFDMLISTILEASINVDAVHLEVLLSNQIRQDDSDDPSKILLTPEWEYPNEPYKMISLKQALKNNPSIAVTLNYKDISKALIHPLQYKKNGFHPYDLFLMEQPEEYYDINDGIERNEDGTISPIKYNE